MAKPIPIRRLFDAANMATRLKEKWRGATVIILIVILLARRRFGKRHIALLATNHAPSLAPQLEK